MKRHAPARGLLFKLVALAGLVLLAMPAFAGDTVYYYLSDSLHSEVIVTDANRNVVETTHYAPYGQVLDRTLRDGPGYTAAAEDPATGLNYMRQRYYDPQTGRFLSTDPMAVTPDGADFNRYEYAQDNPYRYTDPDGRQTTGEAIDAAAEGCGPVSCAGFAILKAVYTLTGAEAVSRVVNNGWSSSSTSQKVEATIAVAGVLPVGRAAEGVADAAKATDTLVDAGEGVSNSVPTTLARVIPANVPAKMLGAPGDADVFVTAAEDIKGLDASGVASRLGIPQSSSGFRVVEFPTPESGLASPVFRDNPGFIGGGKTSGGAREFTIPNGPIPACAKMCVLK